MNFPSGGFRLKLKSLIDFRAVCLALGLALVASLPLLTTLPERREFYLFEVALTSTGAGLTRISWDAGQGFNERDSSVQPLTANTTQIRYRYLLPTGVLRGLRFSPIDRPAVITMMNARIIDRKGAVIHNVALGDFIGAKQIATSKSEGDLLHVETTTGAEQSSFDIRLGSPLVLPLKSGLLVGTAAPVFLPVFILGLLLSSPWIINRFRQLGVGPLTWAKANPRRAILIVAGLAVMGQAYPVVFLGRSFVSPNNGSTMLYGQLPTLPGYSDPLASNTMASDVGAFFFHHLYSPMVQREALFEHGELPLWNRYNLAGTPLLGQGQSMFGDPFNFITIVANGASWAWDLRFLLARFVFAAALGLCVRELTRHLGAAALVSLTAPFIGFFLFRINHPANFSVCYAPLILWAWIGYIRAQSPRAEARWLVMLVLANGIVMTSGTVKEAYMLMVCLNWAGLILLTLLPESQGRRGRLAACALGAGVIFILITAPLWGSFLVTLSHSFTIYDKPSVQTLPLSHVIGFFDEMFYRQGAGEERVAAPSLNFLYLLGALWWLGSPALWLRDRPGLALAMAAALPLSLVFGVIPPDLLVRIPFIGNIQHVENTFSCPLMILTVVLAGCGFHDAIRRAQNGEGLGRRIAVTLASGAALGLAYFSTTITVPKSPFFLGYVLALGFAAVGLSLGCWWAVRSNRPTILAVSLGLALPLLLWRHGQFRRIIFNKYVFTPGVRTDFFAASPVANKLKIDERQPARVVGLQHNLFPTYNVALRWESLYGVDALRNGAYDELAKTFGLIRVWDWEEPTTVHSVAAHRPFYDLLNVSYYLANRGTPAESLAGLQPKAQDDLDLFLSNSAWPRAFFSDQLTSYSSVEEFAAKVQQGDGKPFAAAERSQSELGQLQGTLLGRTIKAATDYRFTTNTTTFTIEAPKAGIAVLTETYVPDDFEVSVNGEPSSYFRVNHAFKGVMLTRAGSYQITFAYRPKHLTLMLWASAAGLFLAAVGAVGLAYRDRASPQN